jgi:hypothetical protein
LAMTAALAVLIDEIDVEHHGGKRGHGGASPGHWANATGPGATAIISNPTVVVPCTVDLPTLLHAAGVSGIDAIMVNQGDLQHGCCGDEICSLGETFENCNIDCAEAGVEGRLVWVRDDAETDDKDNTDDGKMDDDHDDDDDDGCFIVFGLLVLVSVGLLMQIRTSAVAPASDFKYAQK